MVWFGDVSLCGTGSHVFDDDDQAVRYLQFMTSGAGGYVYGFVEEALNSEKLWAYYTTPNGHRAVRWRKGLGWIRLRGLEASQAKQTGQILKHGGKGLIVLGAAVDGLEQWSQDDDKSTGVRVFRSVVVSVSNAGAAVAGATTGLVLAAKYCGFTWSIGCGGPWGSVIVSGASAAVFGFIFVKGADEMSQIVIEEWLPG